MAAATFWQRGESLDYKNTGDSVIGANTVIAYGARIGIAGGDIPAGELGSIHVEGVFALPKTDSEIAAGAEVYWNGSGVTATAGNNVKAGYAAQAAASTDTTVLVKINA